MEVSGTFDHSLHEVRTSSRPALSLLVSVWLWEEFSSRHDENGIEEPEMYVKNGSGEHSHSDYSSNESHTRPIQAAGNKAYRFVARVDG